MDRSSSDDDRTLGAELEISEALAKTLKELAPHLTTKFGISGHMLNQAIYRAALNTAAMAAMATVGAPIQDALLLGNRLHDVVNSEIESRKP